VCVVDQTRTGQVLILVFWCVSNVPVFIGILARTFRAFGRLTLMNGRKFFTVQYIAGTESYLAAAYMRVMCLSMEFVSDQ